MLFLIIIVAIVFGVVYWKMSLPINIILFIVDLFIVDPIPLVDELFMLFVVLKKVKQSIDLAKKGVAVKKTFDFLKKSQPLFDENDDKRGCALIIFIGIILFFLYRAGCV